MSNVTNVLVLIPLWEDRVFNELSQLTVTPVDMTRLVSLTMGDANRLWVGPKGPECHVWAGAFNHLNRAALLERLEMLPWTDRDGVQVLINGQDA